MQSILRILHIRAHKWFSNQYIEKEEVQWGLRRKKSTMMILKIWLLWTTRVTNLCTHFVPLRASLIIILACHWQIKIRCFIYEKNGLKAFKNLDRARLSLEGLLYAGTMYITEIYHKKLKGSMMKKFWKVSWKSSGFE